MAVSAIMKMQVCETSARRFMRLFEICIDDLRVYLKSESRIYAFVRSQARRITCLFEIRLDDLRVYLKSDVKIYEFI